MIAFRGYRPNPPQGYIDKNITNGPDQPDYEGVVLSDGTVVLHWLTPMFPGEGDIGSFSIFLTWVHFWRIHGHPEYGTEIRWEKVGADPMIVPGFDHQVGSLQFIMELRRRIQNG